MYQMKNNKKTAFLYQKKKRNFDNSLKIKKIIEKSIPICVGIFLIMVGIGFVTLGDKNA